MRRRTLLRSAAVAATIGGAGFAGAGRHRDGREPTDVQQTTTEAGGAQETATAGGEFSIRTSAWENGETIPTEYTCDGENVSPALEIESLPEDARSFALVMDDPDAPNPPFVHWLLWDVPADAREIPRDVPADETVDSLDGSDEIL